MKSIETSEHFQVGEAQKLPLRTQRIAWTVLIVSFVAFCVVCAAVTYGIYGFLFESTLPLNVSVSVARGSVGLVRTDSTESFELVRRALSRGDTVLTDSQSQAVITWRDPLYSSESVAALTLKNNSRIVVRNATRPRFNWSGRGYHMALNITEGEIDIWVSESLARHAGLSLTLPEGAGIDISEAGSYTLSVTQNEVTLTTRRGTAAILPPQRENSRSVVSGQVGIYSLATGVVRVENGMRTLLDNSYFAESAASAFNREGSAVALPVMNTWNCSDRTVEPPLGHFMQAMFDGRRAMRLVRADGAQNHGETTCIQPFGPSGQVGLRVDGYRFLSFRSTFYIENHSLDGCGVQGSECPLMILMDYVDIEGRSNQWFQGFYAQLRERGDYPLTCLSCQQEHKRVNPSAWYTYESGNLIGLLPAERRPSSILNVRFYASGHEYDLYVSEFSLLAAPADVAPPASES